MASFSLELVHFDICKLMTAMVCHIFIIFIDDYTRFGFVLLDFSQVGSIDCFRYYVHLVEYQKNKILKSYIIDHRRGYLFNSFKAYVKVKNHQPINSSWYSETKWCSGTKELHIIGYGYINDDTPNLLINLWEMHSLLLITLLTENHQKQYHLLQMNYELAN